MTTLLKFAGFISAVLIVLFGAHYWLYASIIRFFSVSDPAGRQVLRWLMVFFALSFFPSAILLRLHLNIFTRVFYIISCHWLGLFLYLLMALIITWVIYGVARLFGAVPDMRMVALVFFMAAAAYSAYGLRQARHPRLTRMDVKIEGLPNHWRGKTLVQLSDVHLGTIQGVGFLKRIVEQVNSVKPDLVLITGDLFDGMGGDLPSFIAPLNDLMAAKGIFFVTGNHEGYLGLDEPLSVLKKTKIRILDNDVADVEGLQIVGVPFPEHGIKNGAAGLLTEAGSYDPDKPAVLMYHTPTNIAERNKDRAAQQAKTYWFPDTDMTLVKKAGIDLQLSGHTHQGQLFPFGFLTRIIYRGFDYGLHKEGGFHLYVTSGTGTWGPPMRTGGSSEIVVITLR